MRHGARPLHQIIKMIKWIWTSRLSIKNSLSGGEWVWCDMHLPARRQVPDQLCQALDVRRAGGGPREGQRLARAYLAENIRHFLVPETLHSLQKWPISGTNNRQTQVPLGPFPTGRVARRWGTPRGECLARADLGGREFFIDNLLVRVHCIIVKIWWTGLAPRELEFPFPGSLISTFLGWRTRTYSVSDRLRSAFNACICSWYGSVFARARAHSATAVLLGSARDERRVVVSYDPRLYGKARCRL